MRLPEFSERREATVVSVRPAAHEQVRLTIEPPAGFAAAHERAGQFCKIEVDGLEGIFAMMSAPGEKQARFLLRTNNAVGGEAADRLATLGDGATIRMSAPAGDGFPLERARGRDVYFVATGTGIAPVCAAIDAVLARRADYGQLSLDHGLRTERHLAITEETARWQAQGLAVHLCYSDVGNDGALHGITVQDALIGRHPDLSNAAIVAVGQSAMLASLRAAVARLGVDPSLVLTNI